MNISHSFFNLVKTSALLLMVIGLWSCGASRQATTPAKGMLSKNQFIAQYGERTLPLAIDARGNVSIQTSGKEVSSGIRMLLSPNEYFELSARPLGLIEVARVTIDAKQGILVLDRINRRAFKEEKIDYWTRQAKDKLGFNPIILRAIGQNEPFDATESGISTLKGMTMDYVGSRYHFYTQKNGVQIHHYFSKAGDLVETAVNVPNEANVSARYSDFETLTNDPAKRPYPKVVEVKVTPLKTNVGTHTLLLEINRISTSDAPIVRQDMNIPSGYRQVTVEELIKILKAQ